MEIERTTNDVLLHVSRPAMAGEFEISFPAQLYPEGVDLALETLDIVESLEKQLSFFDDNSEISRINREAVAGPVEVEPHLFELLSLAMLINKETGGAYDITSTPLWEAWGFARRAARVPSETELSEARRLVGGHLVKLDPNLQTIRLLEPGVRISLGSIGKGYALDLCAERLLAGGMSDFLLHGDFSSVLAHGSQWQVGIRHPEHPDRRLGVLRLQDRALGTSGIQFQSFQENGRRFGHIFDPRTGWPVEGVLSTTVVAPTAAMADMLSTALFVLGPRAASDYCHAHPEIGAVMVTAAHADATDITIMGLSEDVLTLEKSDSATDPGPASTP